MKGFVEIIGINSSFKELKNESFNNCELKFNNGIHELILNNKKYILDLKKTYILCDHLVLEGFISDDSTSVGRISLKFIPKNLDIS